MPEPWSPTPARPSARYAPEELARLEAELASVDLGDLFGRLSHALSSALDELAHDGDRA